MVAHMVETKVPVIAPNFFPSFISDIIISDTMSMPCTLALGDAHIIKHKSISRDGFLFLKDETSHACVHSDTIMQGFWVNFDLV